MFGTHLKMNYTNDSSSVLVHDSTISSGVELTKRERNFVKIITFSWVRKQVTHFVQKFASYTYIDRHVTTRNLYYLTF